MGGFLGGLLGGLLGSLYVLDRWYGGSDILDVIPYLFGSY